MLLLFIFLVLRHIALLLARLMLARNCSLAWAWLRIIVFCVCLHVSLYVSNHFNHCIKLFAPCGPLIGNKKFLFLFLFLYYYWNFRTSSFKQVACLILLLLWKVPSRYVFSCVICFRFIHFIFISTVHALFLTCLPVSIYGT